QIAGKDNLRPQALMWQAMLMSAGLEPSRQIFIDGFITAGGQKMSKSLGNIIGPQELTKYFGIDAVRYYLLAQVNDNDDGDYSPERFKEVYEADLANGLGNLFSRLGNLAWRHNLAPIYPHKDNELYNKVIQLLYNWHFNQAIGEIWSKFRELDKILTQEEPWKMKAEEAQACLKPLIQQLVDASYCLTIFLPQSAAKILDFFSHTAHDKPEPLFPRLNYL
ncbi:MAG TPA: class I tRNA ligase family protein, partial [bacterium]|nr:class I tRNA ligase family protein [bacterium]